MADKAVRLRFTEDDLSDKDIRRAARKAEKAADRADHYSEKAEKASGKAAEAEEKIPTRRRVRITRESGTAEAKAELLSDKLRTERSASVSMKKKLRVEVVEEKAKRPGAARRALTHAPAAAVSAARKSAHDSIGAEDDGNAGAEALQGGESGIMLADGGAGEISYGRKLKPYRNAEKLERRAGQAEKKADRMMRKSDRANVDALFEKELHGNPETVSNPLSKWRQKQELKKRYAEAKKAGEGAKAAASGAAKGAGKAAGGAKSVMDNALRFVKDHPKTLLTAGALALLLMVIAGMFSSCTAMFTGGGNTVLGGCYTAEDADINGADEDYTALETALRNQISSIESTHPGYDEYRYSLAEIGHDPFELASYLTVVFEDYTRAEVQGALQALFDSQYELTLEEEIEVRTRTETRTGTRTVTDPETGEESEEEYEYEVEVEYNYYILNVTLTNTGLGSVVQSSGLTADQLERYAVLMETRGGRDGLFAGNIYVDGGSGDYLDYDIPGEALTDEKFRKMIAEAEKYLGFPYVWGGSSPGTSFDCSGFVSWVINNCGNGWSVGRQTANGLKNLCGIIPASEAKPGDLIFFQGTYDTSGASHVGIYVGDGMMIHCGSPISYANFAESSYWQGHFLCFGRLS